VIEFLQQFRLDMVAAMDNELRAARNPPPGTTPSEAPARLLHCAPRSGPTPHFSRCAASSGGAIKIAPFNRYHTVDVMRGVAESGRAGEIALYTGNDDHIVLDLITTFRGLHMVGGLLGHWAVWTCRAVAMLLAVAVANTGPLALELAAAHHAARRASHAPAPARRAPHRHIR
jgi:hypothetical protein